MNKTFRRSCTAVILSAAMLLSACSNAEHSESTTASAATVEQETEITTKRVSAVENQPEETLPPAESTSSAENGDEPSVSEPPEFPVPYPAATVNNPEALAEFKKIITTAETAISVMDGSKTLIPLAAEQNGGYRLISSDYAENLQELTERMYEGIKYTFWEDHFGKEIEDMLPDYVKETDSGIMLKTDSGASRTEIETDSAVLTALDDTTARVKALGKLGDNYIWRTYDILNGTRGWVIREFSDEKVTGEISVFSQLLIANRETLDKIFGNAKPITDSDGNWNTRLVTIENDPYGHGFYNGLEIEPFMTVEEMKQYIRDSFTKEIAESYISLYINRTYVEKDGKLYIISGSVLPQMGEFSLENYESRSVSSYDVTSLVEWTDGENTYSLPITIAYENGKWKVDTRLPMRSDRVIEK